MFEKLKAAYKKSRRHIDELSDLEIAKEIKSLNRLSWFYLAQLLLILVAFALALNYGRPLMIDQTTKDFTPKGLALMAIFIAGSATYLTMFYQVTTERRFYSMEQRIRRLNVS